MKIFIEEYKGYEIFFNKDEVEFEFQHDILGLIQWHGYESLKDCIDKYSEAKFISPIRAYDIRSEGRYIDVLGLNSDGSYIVRYENGHMVNMVSTAGKQYYLGESQWIIDKIKKYEEQIGQIKDNVEDLKSSIKTIESLEL